MSEKFRSKKMLSLGLGHKVMKNLGSNQTTLSSVKLWSRSGLANPGLHASRTWWLFRQSIVYFNIFLV